MWRTIIKSAAQHADTGERYPGLLNSHYVNEHTHAHTNLIDLLPLSELVCHVTMRPIQVTLLTVSNP